MFEHQPHHPRKTFPVVSSLLGLASCLVLAFSHILALNAPGCGFSSGCVEASRSSWATVPFARVPVAFIGAAYFTGVLAYLLRQGTYSCLWPLRWLVRLGALTSLTYVFISVLNRLWCPYCAICHTCSLGIWVWWECGKHHSRFVGVESLRGPIVAASAILAALIGTNALFHTHAADRARHELAESVSTAAAQSKVPSFTGRYRLGPEVASVRIVIFTDYQCPDCREVERQAELILESRADVSLSIKQFPFCSDCNPYVQNSLHPNACWSARAAETAGMIGGSDGFWKMHRWLVARAGAFTDAELTAGLNALAFDRVQFVRVMQSDEPLVPIRSDIEEGIALGLFQTPMIFLNGVELRGWQTPNALIQAVTQLVATSPKPQAPLNDKPENAAAKAVADWRRSPNAIFRPCEETRTQGPESAAVSIVLFGDYQEPFTAEADAKIRVMCDSEKSIRYEFRHFPVNSQCNPVSPRVVNPMACRMARTAEAAAMVGGRELFWLVHEWTMQHQRDFSDAGIRSLVAQTTFGADTVLNTAKTPNVSQAIENDCVDGGKAGITSVPAIFVNGKLIPRWKVEGVDVLKSIVDDAMGAGAARGERGGGG